MATEVSAGAVSFAAEYHGNLVLTIETGVIATVATTLKYLISPDSHQPAEMINDYLKPIYQSMDLH